MQEFALEKAYAKGRTMNKRLREKNEENKNKENKGKKNTKMASEKLTAIAAAPLAPVQTRTWLVDKR